MSECESDAAYHLAEGIGQFVCGELGHPRRYFKTFGELEEHRHAEHRVECAASPAGSTNRCRKPIGHAGRHSDGCGNVCLSPAEESEKQKLMRQFGRDEARLDQARRQNEAPAPIVMKRLGDLPPEAQAEVRRLLAEAQRETPKINPICITKTDEPAPRDPPAFCAACHFRAPEEIGYLANQNRKGLRPKRDGWMLAMFPFTEDRAAMPEHKLLCPPCGEKVAKFIHHLSTPMLHEEDLL